LYNVERGWVSPTGSRNARPDDRLRRIARLASFYGGFPNLSFRDALLSAGPESILPVVVMDSGLALRAPRNDGAEIALASFQK